MGSCREFEPKEARLGYSERPSIRKIPLDSCLQKRTGRTFFKNVREVRVCKVCKQLFDEYGHCPSLSLSFLVSLFLSPALARVSSCSFTLANPGPLTRTTLNAPCLVFNIDLPRAHAHWKTLHFHSARETDEYFCDG